MQLLDPKYRDTAFCDLARFEQLVDQVELHELIDCADELWRAFTYEAAVNGPCGSSHADGVLAAVERANGRAAHDLSDDLGVVRKWIDARRAMCLQGLLSARDALILTYGHKYFQKAVSPSVAVAAVR